MNKFFCKLTMDNGEVVKLKTPRNGVLTRENVIKYIDECIGVEIGDTCSTIGKKAFQEFKNLKEVKFGNNVKKIETLAFFGSGISKIELNESLESISLASFAFCDNITEVDIPNSVKRIGDYAFFNCIKLEKVKLPNGIKKISQCVFLECTSLSNVIIPNTVEEIGKRAFMGCESLTSINIPSSVISIKEEAFRGTHIKE